MSSDWNISNYDRKVCAFDARVRVYNANDNWPVPIWLCACGGTARVCSRSVWLICTARLPRCSSRSPAPIGRRSQAASPCRTAALRASPWRTRSSAPPRWHRRDTPPGRTRRLTGERTESGPREERRGERRGRPVSDKDESRCALTHARMPLALQMHLVMSMSYLVVRLLPSARGSASMVMACAGHTASHSLHAMQRSSPEGYRRSACSPRKRGESGAFSYG